MSVATFCYNDAGRAAEDPIAPDVATPGFSIAHRGWRMARMHPRHGRDTEGPIAPDVATPRTRSRRTSRHRGPDHAGRRDAEGPIAQKVGADISAPYRVGADFR
ncbi:MAG: hypothetical protein M3Z30_06990 [Gemmatimonadota bacterium]|nr:hypothetical protein [Gemmatimonadota bacterium]